MIIRALDAGGDWTFGKGRNNFSSGNAAIAVNIQTRVLSFLGDCFFDTSAGIDWFTYLGGSKDQVSLNLAVSAVILNTQFVTGLSQLSINLNRKTRGLIISYAVNTVFTGTTVFSGTIALAVNYILTEGGDVLVDESGNAFTL